MTLKTLDDFMKSAAVGKRQNAYVRFPGFKHLYVRHTQRYLNGEVASPVLDLANMEALKPGNGTFTKLLKHLRKKYPEYWLYAESVLTPQFEKGLLARGFIQCSESPAPSFYLPPRKAHEPEEQGVAVRGSH